MTRLRGFPSASATGGILCLVLASSLPGHAADTSTWAVGAHSRARLIAAGAAPAEADHPPALLAGVEVALAPHFITYWRDPGDAGVPPNFDFGGSENLASAAVRFPAPMVLDEAGAKAFGYRDDVVFPVIVTPADPTRPVRLHVKLDYAACHDICLPVKADLVLDMDGETGSDASEVRAALAAVPRRVRIGDAHQSLRILAVTPAADGFAVESRSAPGGDLFVEAPEGWAYAAGPGTAEADGRTVFHVKRLDGPKGERVPASPVVLTLVAPGGAIEVPVQLDAEPPKP